jgi:hypothetical protein
MAEKYRCVTCFEYCRDRDIGLDDLLSRPIPLRARMGTPALQL